MSTNYFHRRLKIRLMGKTNNSGFVVPVAFVLFAGGGGGGGGHGKALGYEVQTPKR